MAKPKRPAFAFPELEGRGRRAILRPADEVSAELNALEQQAAPEDASKERIKVTYRFKPEAVEAATEAEVETADDQSEFRRRVKELLRQAAEAELNGRPGN
jgi:hypothetical protein